MDIAYVEPRFINVLWNEVEPLLQKAVDTTNHAFTTDDIKRLLEDTSYHLVVVWEGEAIIAAVVSEIIQYPQKKVISVKWLGGRGGRMEEWLEDVYEYIKQGARKVGADGIELIGRKGWARYFKKETQNEQVILYRDL